MVKLTWECSNCGKEVESEPGNRPTNCPNCQSPAYMLEFKSAEGIDLEVEDGRNEN